MKKQSANIIKIKLNHVKNSWMEFELHLLSSLNTKLKFKYQNMAILARVRTIIATK